MQAVKGEAIVLMIDSYNLKLLGMLRSETYGTLKKDLTKTQKNKPSRALKVLGEDGGNVNYHVQ